MTAFNRYFEQLFELFPQKVPFTNAIIDLCQPLRLSVPVISSHKSGKSAFIKAFTDLLTDQAEFYKTQRKNKAEKAFFGKGISGEDDSSPNQKNERVSANFAPKLNPANEDLIIEEEEEE